MSVYPMGLDGVAGSETVEGAERALGRLPTPALVQAGARAGSGVGARIAAYLIAAIVLLSLGDLAMTLIMVTQLGMVEVNPLARAVMHHGSPGVLAVWKLASVTLACGILYRARGCVIGQLGAWFGFAVLVALTIYWSMYVDHLSAFACASEWAEGGLEDRWVAMISQS